MAFSPVFTSPAATRAAGPSLTHLLADEYTQVGQTRPTACGQVVESFRAIDPVCLSSITGVNCPDCRAAR